jgi:hypothetical protein
MIMGIIEGVWVPGHNVQMVSALIPFEHYNFPTYGRRIDTIHRKGRHPLWLGVIGIGAVDRFWAVPPFLSGKTERPWSFPGEEGRYAKIFQLVF